MNKKNNKNNENVKDDLKNVDILPMETFEYTTKKMVLSDLLEDMRLKNLDCKYLLQREEHQWTNDKINKYFTRVANNMPVTEIILCELVLSDGSKKLVLIDGLQRLTYINALCNNMIAVGENGAEFANIRYKEIVTDENGIAEEDENGNQKFEWKVFNIIGKKYNDFPDEIKRRIQRYNMNVTIFFNCTHEMLQYHLRNYNNHSSMNNVQYGITNMNLDIVREIKNISLKHSFFKNCGKYTNKNRSKGILERIVMETLVVSYYIDEWKSSFNSIRDFVNNNATKEQFAEIKDNLTRLEEVYDSEVKDLFDTTNSFIWFAVFNKFKKICEDDMRFIEFMKEFKTRLHTVKVNGSSFDDLGKQGSKSTAHVKKKMSKIIELMDAYLNGNLEESAEETEFTEEIVNENVESVNADANSENNEENNKVDENADMSTEYSDEDFVEESAENVETENTEYDETENRLKVDEKELLEEFKDFSCCELFGITDKNAVKTYVDSYIFMKNHVDKMVTLSDINLYMGMLDDLSLNVNNNSNLFDYDNFVSMLAIVGYSCIADKDVDTWFIDYFYENNTYMLNQKMNYEAMKNSINKYEDK